MKEIFSITADPSKPIDESLLAKYNVRMTGAAMKEVKGIRAAHLVVRSRLPFAKVFVLTSVKSLAYITLMAGNGTNDVGVLR